MPQRYQARSWLATAVLSCVLAACTSTVDGAASPGQPAPGDGPGSGSATAAPSPSAEPDVDPGPVGGEPAGFEECDTAQGAAEVPDPQAMAEEVGGDALSVVATPGWPESEAVVALLTSALELYGVEVEKLLLEPEQAITAAAAGEVDLIASVWLPVTHVDYIESYGDDLESLGCWYDNANLSIAVNDDSPAQSIADLQDMAESYGGQIRAGDPGAGLTLLAQDAVEQYGLDDIEVVPSTVLNLIDGALEAEADGEDYAITMWRPSPAFAQLPLRELADPMGVFGDPESIYLVGAAGFAEDYPQLAQALNNFVLSDEDAATLIDSVFTAGASDDADPWLEQHPDFVDDLIAGTL